MILEACDIKSCEVHYTRNALVAVCFESEIYDKQRNYTYIKRVFRDVLDSSTYEKKL